MINSGPKMILLFSILKLWLMAYNESNIGSNATVRKNKNIFLIQMAVDEITSLKKNGKTNMSRLITEINGLRQVLTLGENAVNNPIVQKYGIIRYGSLQNFIIASLDYEVRQYNKLIMNS